MLRVKLAFFKKVGKNRTKISRKNILTVYDVRTQANAQDNSLRVLSPLVREKNVHGNAYALKSSAYTIYYGCCGRDGYRTHPKSLVCIN